MKLIKRIAQPNERLGLDTQKLYIIDQGRAELQLTRYHHTKAVSKTLRVINNKGEQSRLSVSSNLFGFTAIVLHRKTNLTAVSADFAVVYELQEKDFDELVAE